VVVDFDALFIPDSPKKAGMIAPQLAFYDVNKVLLLGTNLWHSNELIKEAGKYVQFALMADGYYADASKKTVNDFIVAFMEQFGEPPGIIEAFAYDTAMIAFQTASNSTIRSRQDIKEILQHLHNFDGVTGMTSFNENGEADKKLFLLQIDGDKFVEVNGY
jgi:ABC-type branched-subunit amino acid transport system substrate-binding protein